MISIKIWDERVCAEWKNIDSLICIPVEDNYENWKKSVTKTENFYV